MARLARDAAYVIAADRGAEACQAAGVVPDLFCGDDDSASREAVAWARSSTARSLRFPTDKYATDLALAMDCARHEAARRGRSLDLTITCASGGRPDHALAVFGQMLRVADASVRLVEDGFECRILTPGGQAVWAVGSAAPGATFSAIPLAAGTVVSERGMRWELDRFEIALLDDRGISNRVESPDAEVRCHAGAVACFLHHDAIADSADSGP